MKLLQMLWVFAAALPLAGADRPFYDRKHFSEVFGEERNYRILLPPDYESNIKRYPVIYYFHGHSDRYTLEKYDDGKDTIPKMADFVANHDAIVVSVDGYVARDYTGFYGGTPWDIMRDGGDYDFGEYFKELVGHIDKTYRTLTDRRHRATAGLSMGGFMSLWLSARYPQLIGSASAFNPGPEFYVGDKGRRVLWRPKDHVGNHTRTMVRLVRASGDYISQYHEETRDAYARAHDVDFEYRRDEYHRHWATSIGETFDFHMRAFANPMLDNREEDWSHDDPYRSFEVWGYQVEVAGDGAGFTSLQGVSQTGLRVTTRRWAPDGPPVAGRRITITTAAFYQRGARYKWIDYNFSSGATRSETISADSLGRITITVDGAGHQISFTGPGAGGQTPVLLPVTMKDKLRVEPARDLELPIRIYNPRAEAMTALRVTLASAYPTVNVLAGSVEIPKIESGAVYDASRALRVRFTSGAGYFAPVRLEVTIYDGWHSVSENIDVLVIPEVLPWPAAIEVVDGRTVMLPVFRQKGNQGGGAAIERVVTEGKGNGNGVLEPGEEATIWVKMPQGMDPFDKNNWYRAKIYTDSPWLTEVADLEEQRQLEWTSGMQRTSVIRLSPDTPHGTVIPLLLDNESWSYYYTPDVRYGKEDLYQAFQLHTHHLHRWEVKVE
jgi:pimeloyl-ACP methyl ester carboxylesterase